jgi:hypothetical protein
MQGGAKASESMSGLHGTPGFSEEDRSPLQIDAQSPGSFRRPQTSDQDRQPGLAVKGRTPQTGVTLLLVPLLCSFLTLRAIRRISLTYGFHHNPHKEIIMTRNMGSADRIVRTAAAIVIAALLLTGGVSGIASIILGVIAVAFLATSAARFCPVYVPFKVSTGRKTPSRGQ